MSFCSRSRPRFPVAADMWRIRVAAALTACGVAVCARDLGDRTTAEIMRAHAWAELRESLASLPVWLRPFAGGPLASELATEPPSAHQLGLVFSRHVDSIERIAPE